MPSAMVSTTAMAISPGVPPVHALITRATPTKTRAHARTTAMLTDTAPAACRTPRTPPPISSTLRTMPARDLPLGGSISSAGGPQPAPPPPLGGASGGGVGGGGMEGSGSVGVASLSDVGGGDHGASGEPGASGGAERRRNSSTPMTMAITANPIPPPR